MKLQRLFLLLILTLAIPTGSWSSTLIDGLYYNLDSSTMTGEVTYQLKDFNNLFYVSGDIKIPNTVKYNGESYTVTSIGESAFYYCQHLTGVQIPNSVTSIGYGAFSGCTGLTSVNISDLEAWCKIDFGNESANPIYYAKNLCLNNVTVTSLTIPTSITKIKYTFTNCQSLTSVIIPNSVTSIGEYAFSGCPGLSRIDIPNSVTSIGEHAFSGCSGLTSVDIPNSINSIGEYAFSGCSGLTSVDIPNSVTSIGEYAFSGCSGLTSVDIPNSINSIGEYAFSGCSGLTRIDIPNSINSIGGSAFQGCSGLNSIVIPYSVTSIGGGAFLGCTGLTSVVIPTSVTSIGGSAFQSCTGLTSVEIPNSVTSIGDFAFAYCTGLANVDIGNSIETLQVGVFENCYSLTNVKIGNSVSIIAWNAFRNCPIETLSINCPNIKNWFQNFETIKTLIIGNSVTSIEKNAFRDCQIETLNINCPSISIGFSGLRKLKNLNIGNSVTSIGNEAFSGCTGLTNVVISNSVTSIGKYAFSGCLFNNFLLEDGIKELEWNDDDVLTTYNLYLGRPIVGYKRLSILESLEVSGFVESLSSYYIRDTERLRTLTINPGGDIIIENGVFKNCKNLVNITLPEDISEIGAYAFKGTAVKNITIPNGTVGEYAFADCNLENIVIGAGVESIGEFAFDNNAVMNIYSTPTTPPAAENNTFSNYEAQLYVPEKAIEAYSNSPCWSLFDIKPLVMPESIEVSGPTTITGKAGETFQLTPTISPSNVSLDRVLWNSTNQEVASVDNNGLVTIHNMISDEEETRSNSTVSCQIIATTLYEDSPVAMVTIEIDPHNTSIVYEIPDEFGGIGESAATPNDIYTMQGVCVKRNAVQSDIDALAPGIYIVASKKIIVR